MPQIPIVLIGHKDHGKSTLISRLLLDSGSVKESRLQDVKATDKAWGRTFELAHLMDSFKEERDKEMTMDTTRALVRGQERNYELIDVPGHTELISCMLTGASSAQAALLVVSVKEGVEEQTRQHLEIAKLLGIEQLGVVMNKIDAVGYSQDIFEKCKSELEEILHDTGYIPKEISFLPVSAKEGDNVIKKSEHMPWYKSKTVMEFLETEIKDSEPLYGADLIFVCQDNYNGLLAGKVESGTATVGQDILVLPERTEGIIESLWDSLLIEKAQAGQNIGMKIASMPHISRGAVVASRSSSLTVSKVVSGEMFWIERPCQRRVVVACGMDQAEGELQNPVGIQEGTKTPYEIHVEKPIVFDSKGKTMLSKIVVKDKGKIIGVGSLGHL